MQLPMPAALVALALAAGACAGPERAPGKAAAAEKAPARTGEKARTAEKEKKPWWRLSQYSREADFKVPWELDGLREGPGLLSKDPDGFVLYRQGEAGSSDPAKPSKVRR